MDASVYGKFASEFFSMPEDKDNSYWSGKVRVTVKYEPQIDQYAVSSDKHNEKIWSQYSVRSEATNRLDGMDLLTHALLNTTPRQVYGKDQHQWQSHLCNQRRCTRVRACRLQLLHRMPSWLRVLLLKARAVLEAAWRKRGEAEEVLRG